ncbi:MAG: PfkB family carbohydrate kinase [Burkholderiales bacterium]
MGRGSNIVGEGARRKRIVAVGSICNTTIFRVPAIPPAPAKVLASETCHLIDSMALSATYAFVKLGGSGLVWSRVGDDRLGAEARAMMLEEGLDVSGLHVVPHSATSRSAIVVDGNGDRLVVPYYDPHADATADWLPLATLAGVDLLHCDPRWPDGAEVALRAARERGILTMIDGDIAPLPTLQRLVPLADLAVFSDAGLLAYAQCDRIDEALVKVAARHRGHVGATCGPDGYRWCEEGHLHHVPAPKVAAIDTLGAGDVFHGAFGLALLEGRGTGAAAQFACAAASLKCTRFGGRLGCPTRSEVDALVAQTYGAAATAGTG